MVLENKDTEASSLYNFSEMPLEGGKGFRLVYHNNGEATTHTYTQITDFRRLPTGASELAEQKSRLGIPVFFGNLFVGSRFLGKGLGTAIWIVACSRLLEKYPRVVNYVLDDSNSPKSAVRTNWTERRLPEILDYMRARGYQAEILLRGAIENRLCWLIEYSKLNTGV